MKKQLPSVKEIENFPQLQFVSISSEKSQKTDTDSELTQKLLSCLEKTLRNLDVDHGPIEVLIRAGSVNNC